MAIPPESTLSQESLTDSRALSRLREIVNVETLARRTTHMSCYTRAIQCLFRLFVGGARLEALID